MSKKLTTEYVRGKVEERGWTFDDDEYLCNNVPFNYTCDKGHKGSMTWSSFNRGGGCWQCAVDSRIKYNITYIRSVFEERGCVLKSTEYVNNYTKLDYVCQNGHEHSISWSHFRRGIGCPYCAGISKPTIEYIAEYLDKRGWVLKSAKYVNAHTKLDCVCPNGHEHSIRWSDFQSGYGCSTCFNIRMAGVGNPSWKGGISCHPYCDAWADKKYKESIKERDGYRCQNPYCSCNVGVLCLHHIDFNKKNCHPSNLITVCVSCNSFANKDREWHIAWYQALMNKKYGYVY